MIEQYRQLLNYLHDNNKKLVHYTTFLSYYKKYNWDIEQIKYNILDGRWSKSKWRKLDKMRKLSDKQIKYALELYSEWYSFKELSKRFNVSQTYFNYYRKLYK